MSLIIETRPRRGFWPTSAPGETGFPPGWVFVDLRV